MITDGPGWAKGTPHQVEEILQAAPYAKHLPIAKRRAVAVAVAVVRAKRIES